MDRNRATAYQAVDHRTSRRRKLSLNLPPVRPSAAGAHSAYLAEQVEVALKGDHVFAAVRRNLVSQQWHGPGRLGGRHEGEDGEHGKAAIVDFNAQAPRFFLW